MHGNFLIGHIVKDILSVWPYLSNSWLSAQRDRDFGLKGKMVSYLETLEALPIWFLFIHVHRYQYRIYNQRL